MPAHNHHFLSQCYLRGFTDNGSKKSKLIGVDRETGKSFATTPRNVGSLRDFNRIDAEGIDPDALENSLSEFEAGAAQALRALAERAKFEGEVLDNVLTLAGLLHVRSPGQREHWRKFQAQVAERIMDITLATPERWENQLRQMREAGQELKGDTSYENAKRFFDSKAYTIDVAREHHIRMEFVGLDAVMPFLMQRRWLLLEATADTGPFVTSDHPVNLSWKEPESVPPFHRNHPGHGMKETRVWFPVSKDLGMIGEFEGREGRHKATKQVVAAMNSMTISFSQRQFYAPNLGFPIVGPNGEIHDGRHLLNALGRKSGLRTSRG
ncbi:MAG: DUF4238 domain-containing protein [Rhodanobacter sp.]